MSPGAPGVKEEPGAEATDRVVEETLADEQAEVKTEPPCEDGAGGASETAAPAGPDCDLDVKDELELGPVRVQARDLVYAFRVSAVKQESGQEPRDDCLRLLTGENLLPCDICGKNFLNLTFLHRHQQEHVRDGPVGVSGMPAQLNTLTCKKQFSRTGEKLHPCDICGKYFLNLAFLHRHQQEHAGPEPVGVSGMSAQLNTLHGLDERIHTWEKTYSCDVCSQEYSQRIQLYKHKRLRHGDSCDRHTRLHTGENPFICKICKKQFTESKNLRRHMTTHTGEKPYSCQICNKTFARSVPSAHRRTHTGERPFSCEICNKTFARSVPISHRRKHTGERPFSCQICNKTYKRPITAAHRRTHTGEKPYACEICSKKFTSSTNLRKHRRTH